MKIRFGNDKNKHVQIKMSRKIEKKLQFKVGEYVFHECDAKKPHMLMIVDSIDERNGLIETHYIDEKFAGRKWHGYESELRLNNEAGEGDKI